MAAETIENVKPADGSSGQRTAAPRKVLRAVHAAGKWRKADAVRPKPRPRCQVFRHGSAANHSGSAGANLPPSSRKQTPPLPGVCCKRRDRPRPSRGGGAPLSQGRGWRLAHRPDRNSVDSQEKSGFRDKKLEVTRPFAAGTPSTCRRDGSPRHPRSPSRRGGSRPAVHTVHYQFTFFYFSVHQPTVPAIAR